MRDTQDWKQKRMHDALTSCAEVVGGRTITDKLANFYLKELSSVEWDLVKRAFNSFTSRGRFPTVDDIRNFAGQRASFDGKPTDTGRTHEQKHREENAHRTHAAQMSTDMPFAIELWAQRDGCSEQEAVKDFEDQLKELERSNVYRNKMLTSQIRPSRVTVHDSIAQGNKTIEQPRQRWKAMIICDRILPEPAQLKALPAPADEF